MAIDILENVNRLELFDTKSWSFTFNGGGAVSVYNGKPNPNFNPYNSRTKRLWNPRKPRDDRQFFSLPSRGIDFETRVHSISAPFFELVTESKNTGRKYLTTFTAIPNVSITFIESPYLDIQNYLINWKESIFKSDEAQFQEGYGGFRNGTLTIDLPNGNQKKLQFIEMRVISISPVIFDYSDKIMLIEAEFSISQIGGYQFEYKK